MVVVDPAQDVTGCILVAYGRVERVHPADLLLDTRNPTGRFHCRLWLLEQGYDVGNEDRAEVLAWSVLSVWRGGAAMPTVAGKWEAEGGDSHARYHLKFKPESARYGLAAACVWPEKDGWRTWPPDVGTMDLAAVDGFGRPHGPETGDAGKDAADAELLALGWALTNADGSLTLPPLPEGA